MYKITKKIDNYYKLCTAGGAALAAGIALFLTPFISPIIERVREGNNLKEAIENLLKALAEYKKEYTFGEKASDFEELIKSCQSLLNVLSQLNVQNNPNVLNVIQQYINHSSNVESLASACKMHIDKMKNFGGRLFDSVKGYSLGYKTLTVEVESAIDVLYKQLSAMRPQIDRDYKKLTEEAQKALSKQSLESDFDLEDSDSNPLDNFANIAF